MPAHGCSPIPLPSTDGREKVVPYLCRSQETVGKPNRLRLAGGRGRAEGLGPWGCFLGDAHRLFLLRPVGCDYLLRLMWITAQDALHGVGFLRSIADTREMSTSGFFKTARLGVEDTLTLFSRQTPPIGGKSAEKSCDSVAFATADTCGLNPPSRWFPSQSPETALPFNACRLPRGTSRGVSHT